MCLYLLTDAIVPEEWLEEGLAGEGESSIRVRPQDQPVGGL